MQARHRARSAGRAEPEGDARHHRGGGGQELGVQGTPTFFINGEMFTESPVYDGLEAAIDTVLAE
ncbi:thioredoxin domain-containing protein [Asanoa sp. NPDC049573]|uniref:DsbA family protein n=1 Tax=Asanoa sp. NPDC049573 TaxID=3155396 RepID=UPI00341AE233